MSNRVCDLLKIRYPIIQGAMQRISDSNLVAAVSKAGGLGVLATYGLLKDDVYKEIKETRRKTDNPFAVNISMLSTTVDDIAQLVMEESIDIVVTSAGNPERFMKDFKRLGIKVISVVGAVRQAVKMEGMGADVIVAEGQEAGGHIGEMTTMAMIPQIADSIQLPVVAAGGIADGRGMAAAFILGAEGVQMGTIFLPCTECAIHPNFKKAVLESNSDNVVVTGRCIGNAVRVMNNALAKEFINLEKANAPKEAYENLGTGALRRAVIEGDMEMGSVMIGQIVGLVKSQDSVADTIQRVLSEYNRIVKNNLLKEI